MIRTVIGVLLLIVGVVWFFQGIGVIHGSFMTGSAFWAVMGVVCVVVAALLIVSGMRINRTRTDE